MTYGILNKLITKPGERDNVVAILKESGKLLDNHAGKQLYLVTTSNADENVIYVIDHWDSKEAHQSAIDDPAMQPYVKQAVPLLEGLPEQTELTVK